MKLSTLLFTSLIAVGAAAPAQAEFIFGDYLTEGDNLTVIDTDTSLSWLNLTITQGDSYDTTLERTLTGDLTGWRIATADEVATMFDDFFDYADFNSETPKTYRSSGEAFEETKSFAYTFGTYGSDWINAAYGYFGYDDEISQAGGYTNDGSYTYLMTIGAQYTVDTSTTHEMVGTFLVSGYATSNSVSSVPVPLAFGALGLGLLGFTRRRTTV